MRIFKALKHFIWVICKKFRDISYRRKFTNREISINSMNCTDGILYHDLRLQFLSPTINMYMRAEDFIKFCENMDYYLSIDNMEECTAPTIIGNREYPVACLGDIYLFLVHYHSVAEAQTKWDSRKRRINKDKIVIIDTDREGMTPSLKDRFENLPYKKVMFTHHPDSEHPSCYYLKGYETQECVGIIDAKGIFGLRPIDQFDWVGFLNDV